jgi:hypothetical protein
MLVAEERLRPNIFKERHRPVGAWLSLKDFELFQGLAKKNKVSVSLYLRAIIVDILEEERTKSNIDNSLND